MARTKAPPPVTMEDNPLTEEHLAILNKIIASCSRTREYLQRCERCNIDVTREMADNIEQLSVCEAIKREFFPNAV